ncbi:MAG UNVERIFIED_CONTAM: hypothetical protein LVT10_00795 [Anaerolineae bacterium]|jgi:hypothetical protein
MSMVSAVMLLAGTSMGVGVRVCRVVWNGGGGDRAGAPSFFAELSRLGALWANW